MTLITFEDGKAVFRDSKAGTGQACCCGGEGEGNDCTCETFAAGEGFTIAQTGPWGASNYSEHIGDCPAGADEYCLYQSGTPPNPPYLDPASSYYYANWFGDVGPAGTVNSLDVFIQCVSGQWIAQIAYRIYGNFPACPGNGFVPPDVELQWYDLVLPRNDADCLPTGTVELGSADYVLATDFDGNVIKNGPGDAPACFNLTLPDILFGRP